MLSHPDRLDRSMVAMWSDIVDLDGPDCLGELISLFLDTFSGQLAMLLDHAETGDSDGLRRLALDMRLSSASVGAGLLATLCGELEASDRRGTAHGTAALVWRIVDEFKYLRPELEALLPAQV